MPNYILKDGSWLSIQHELIINGIGKIGIQLKIILFDKDDNIVCISKLDAKFDEKLAELIKKAGYDIKE